MDMYSVIVILIMIGIVWCAYWLGSKKSNKELLEEKDILNTATAKLKQKKLEYEKMKEALHKPVVFSDKEVDTLAKKMYESYSPTSKPWTESSSRTKKKWLKTAKTAIDVFLKKKPSRS